jgi:hypothetical protein
MEQGNIPYMSYIRIIRDGVMTQIPCERIRELHVSHTTNWKWVGLAAGLAVDCTAFLLLRSLARYYDFSDFHL